MESTHKSNAKAKLIVWCVLIAAVAIIYFAVSARAHPATGLTAVTAGSSATTAPASSVDTSNNMSPMTGSSAYKDGTYSASASYRTPHSIEDISVKLTVKSGTVTVANVIQNPSNGQSAEYQYAFQQSYQPYVVGKKLSDIQLSRVSGSSLTSLGFNAALDQIKSQARS